MNNGAPLSLLVPHWLDATLSVAGNQGEAPVEEYPSGIEQRMNISLTVTADRLFAVVVLYHITSAKSLIFSAHKSP